MRRDRRHVERRRALRPAPLPLAARMAWAAALASALLSSPAGADPSVQATPSAVDTTIVPGQRLGALTVGGSEADLVRAYGTAAVETARVELGEGETALGSALFADDPLRRVEILWSDTLERREPTRAILRGPASLWKLPEGITLGTTLLELERLNGRPFLLAGFGWDYGGVVTSWEGGELERALAGRVFVYLEPATGGRDSADYGSVLGDRDFRSDLPAMRRLMPRVYQLYVGFP